MKQKLGFTTVFMFITLLFALVSFSAATYAWFTFNRSVSTNTVGARTSQADVKLLLSETGFTGFSGKEECPIVQVNTHNVEKLMPVSTDDLKNFCIRTGDGSSSGYQLVTDEANYYHGRVYIMASSENSYNASKLALYLDNTDKMFEADSNALVLNATRVGLLLSDENGQTISTTILRPTEEQNPAGQRENNTFVGGTLAAEGVVISNATNAVSDPSKPLSDYDVSTNSSAESLGDIDINKVYQLDIFFYLEGCDLDCNDGTELGGANMHLAFYGAMM